MNDDLLVKYLLGEATPDEHRQVDAWVAAADANKKYFDHFKLIWDESKKLEGRTTVNTDAAWSRLMERAGEEEKGVGSDLPGLKAGVRKIQFPAARWLRVAAVLLLMVSGAWMVYQLAGGGSEVVRVASAEEVMIQQLPDGSVVTLNKHSELTYPKHFKGDERNVTLKGEAFFNITPDKTKPFVIAANESSVTVVGTSFNVLSRNGTTEVIVETGIVRVAKDKNEVQLLPGEKATVTTLSAAPRKEEVKDKLYKYYRTDEFVCDSTPLFRVVDKLNEAFGLHIIFGDEELKALPLTTTFPANDSPEHMLEVITATFGISAEHMGNAIILKER